ncbi:hypothetical protein [Bacillus cereus]|uniref:hypothetical protein n=1 Tax=Bacillus cereus TaxID=1396 RepID=UPI0030130659
MYSVDLHTVERYGTRFDGTGVYGTTVHHMGSFSVARVLKRGKNPMFYIEGHSGGESFHHAFSTFKHKQFLKILERNMQSGTLAKEEFIKIGFRNAMNNFMVYQELQNRATV